MATRPSEPARHLPIEGIYNFRDVGGYSTRDGGTVRWRTLLRSGQMNNVTKEGRRAIHALGLQSAIDLRYAHELVRFPSPAASWSRITYRHLPLGPPVPPFGEPADTLEELYAYFLDSCQTYLAAVLKALAAPGGFPAVVSCAGGKDKTGVVIALLLELAEVHRETVVDDWALSRTYTWTETQVHEFATREGHDPARVACSSKCEPEAITTTLHYLDTRYGGAERFSRRLGLTSDDVAALRSALVERP